VIHTRPDLLSSILKDVSPVLISRFGDREQTVRLEVWATYSTLLSQVSTYGGPLAKSGETPVGGKRKREEEMDIEESPHALLRAQVPGLSKALLAQIRSPKTTTATLQAGFELLKGVLSVAPGSLAAQTPQIFVILKNTLSQSSSTTTSGLHTTCLAFLSSYFSTHPPAAFANSLPGIAPTLLRTCQERHPRVSSEAFRAFSSLLRALKPVKGGDWVDSLYELSVKKLCSSDTDTDVRSSAEQCIGTLWVCATEVMQKKDKKEWGAICRTTGRTEGAVEVVSMVAREVHIDDNWVNGCVAWVMVLLQKSGRSGKTDVFTCLDLLLKRLVHLPYFSIPTSQTSLTFFRYGSGLPTDLPSTLLPHLRPYISTSDTPLLAQAMAIVALLLRLAPPTTFPLVEREFLKDVTVISCSPLAAGVALESLLSFYGSLVEADMQIASHVIPNLVSVVERAPKPEVSYSNVGKCIAEVVKNQKGIAAGTISEFTRHLKVRTLRVPLFCGCLTFQ
jgi:cullin-associated NEDD8-dissociated protein 1